MATLLLCLGAVMSAMALPSPSAAPDPVRILPPEWEFDITSLSGPGCPDPNTNWTDALFDTRPTFGSNTVDGSEIYYWHFAYPDLRASVGPGTPNASIWCETTLRYMELDKNGLPPVQPEYRLKLHKNGTELLAWYNLDEGVQANWKFTYYADGGNEVVDTILVNGPRHTTLSDDHDYSAPASELVQWKLPNCGAGYIKFRTELTLMALKDGANGTVGSELITHNGRSGYYGVQPGISYDWEHCSS